MTTQPIVWSHVTVQNKDVLTIKTEIYSIILQRIDQRLIAGDWYPQAYHLRSSTFHSCFRGDGNTQGRKGDPRFGNRYLSVIASCQHSQSAGVQLTVRPLTTANALYAFFTYCCISSFLYSLLPHLPKII